jgi:hypothetical protein
MSYKNITVGNKKGKPVGARWVRPKDKLAIEIEFEFLEASSGTQERLCWRGWFPQDKPQHCEKVMRTLVETLGFNGNDSYDPATGLLTDPNAFDWSRESQIVVESEEFEGKTRMGIAWVNKLGGGQFAACAPTVLKQELGAIGFKALFLETKKKLGVTTTSPAAAHHPRQPSPQQAAAEQPTPLPAEDDLPW